MDQQELRELERRCIQEEPPECTAACPLHVDARGFIGHLQAGRWNAALTTLRHTMPLPGILGRICDAPCENRCKRGAAGDPIRIGALERCCVSHPEAPAHRLTSLPARGRQVAVVGSGLSGLTVAWDLQKKGYAVTVFEPGPLPGASLLAAHPNRLCADVVAAEIDLLATLGVRLETGGDPASPDILRCCRETFDALYLGRDGLPEEAWPLLAKAHGIGDSTPGLQTTAREGVFAGGRPPVVPDSPVGNAAEGRWAATSIDRFLQRVSLTAGRDRDGPQPTRLFTSLSGVAACAAIPMADPPKGFTEAEARAEAARCLMCQCLECVKVCPYLERFGAYPRRYAREIYNNAAIVMGPRTANRLINSCSLCGLCEAVCPENFAMQDLCLQARRSMVARGKMPPSAHEFALQDMDFSLGARFLLARHAPGREESAYAFFPGCQLCASSPGAIAPLYAHLRRTLPGGVGLLLTCCGAPARWAGQETAVTAAREVLRARWEFLGRPQLIAACATCHRMLGAPEAGLPVRSLWEVLDEIGPPPTAAPVAVRPLVILDPCTTRHAPAVQAAVRRLLARRGIALEELPLTRELTECCGFGGLMQNANPDLARTVVQRRARLSPRDYVAYCAMCRDNFAATGKRVVHLLDLLLDPAPGIDPAARMPPGWSARRENRARLKRELLRTLWGESADALETQCRIVLHIAPEVAARLDRDRILAEDLQQVIQHAETTGRVFRQPESARRKAAFKPCQVTFWVEYSPREDGFEVHNAYAHRMEVHYP
jgi:glutamate synthase (NADPH/NADH) small chain